MQVIPFVKSGLARLEAEVVYSEHICSGMMLLPLSHWTHSRTDASIVTTRHLISATCLKVILEVFREYISCADFQANCVQIKLAVYTIPYNIKAGCRDRRSKGFYTFQLNLCPPATPPDAVSK